MHHYVKSAALAAALCLSVVGGSSAFVVQPKFAHKGVVVSTAAGRTTRTLSPLSRPQSRLFDTSGSASTDADTDNEIERLRLMAAQLRAEAAELEAEKMQTLAEAAEKAFNEFDTNKDGEISLAELKEGLESNLSVDLSETRVKQLMEAFDTSGDGALQLDEFVGIDQFRNKLEALARDEKALAKEAAQQAKLDAEAAVLAEARLAILNEKDPTNTDKLVSILPYLFPLLDGLQYGRFLLQGDESVFLAPIAILYTIYRSIPLSGFVAFLALSFLSNNPSLNKLVRFNMQQAIFIDIALFVPGLIYGIYTAILTGLGMNLPTEFTEISTDAVFVTLLLTLAYCGVSSLLGVTPDKIPFLSQAVTDRMPTIDMFDDEGRFIPRELREEKDEKKKDDDDKDKKD